MLKTGINRLVVRAFLPLQRHLNSFTPFSNYAVLRKDEPVSKFSTSSFQRSTSNTKKDETTPKSDQTKKETPVDSQSTNEELFSESEMNDWFKSPEVVQSGEKGSPTGASTNIKRVNEMNPAEKRAFIEDFCAKMKSEGKNVPSLLKEEDWENLLQRTSKTSIENTLKFLIIQEYRDKQKLERKEETASKMSERLAENKLNREERIIANGGFLTNYPGYTCFIRHLSPRHEKVFENYKWLTSVRTNAPSIVFDFRFNQLHNNNELKSSLIKQLNHVIDINRGSSEPFQVHFCNYSSCSSNKRLSEWVDDFKLIQDTSKSYTDIFPRDKLIYLSGDAREEMTEFEPDKVYIIGALIDKGFEAKDYTRLQASQDGIRCMRLPLDRYVKWAQGGKNLTLNAVFSILTGLYNKQDWLKSIKGSIAKRLSTERTEFDKPYQQKNNNWNRTPRAPISYDGGQHYKQKM